MQSVSDLMGIPIDQAKFLISEGISLVLGVLFRNFLPPSPQNILKRQLFSITFGLGLGFFCFGSEYAHIVLVAIVSYVSLLVLPRKNAHLIVFVFVMLYLSCIHLYLQIYYYGEKNLDITSPMMILTQKLTYLAFSYYDSSRPVESLTKFQKTYVLEELPSVLDTASYIFNFQSAIIGPSCLYQDYKEYITGENVKKYKKNDPKIDYNQLNVNKVVLFKLIRVAIMIVILLNVTAKLPVKTILEPAMLNQPLWYRFVYMYICCNSHRLKYYIAWILSDAVHNSSGFGFNGFDVNGISRWDLLNNVNILGIEKSTSAKMVLDNWHIQTSLWLRTIAFERMPRGKTMGVFMLSAFWHGFYPGYYITFSLIAFLIYIGRGIRRNIRPFFLKNKYIFKIYDVFCWVLVQFAMNYITTPFHFLDLWTSVRFFNSWYWCVQIAIVLIAIALPRNSFESKIKKEN